MLKKSNTENMEKLIFKWIVALLLGIVSSGVNEIFAANVPLIREDRVWEYAFRGGDGWGEKWTNLWEIIQMKFE